MSRKIEVKVTHRFQATAERVYDAWLDPVKVRIWLKTALQNMGLSGEIGEVAIDARIGGSFLFSDLRDGVETRHWGSYIELERPGKILFTWIVDKSEKPDPSRVCLTTEPDGDGCVATIVHEMDAKWADYVAQTEKGWLCMLKESETMAVSSRDQE